MQIKVSGTANQDASTNTAAGYNEYIVKLGDCLVKIAREHSMTLKDLLNLNPGIAVVDFIYPGDKIKVRK